MSGTVAVNDHGVTEAESAPYHAPPRGAYGYDTGATTPSSLARTGAGGAMSVFRDVDFSVNPYWSVAVGGYYDGAVAVSMGGRERAGVSALSTPTDWVLENELVRVTPNATNARIDVEHHDGTSWETAKTWRFMHSGGSEHSNGWESVAILRNTAEEAVLRLTQGIDVGGGLYGAGLFTVDLTLRRGSRFVTGYYSRSVSDTLGVELVTAEAATAVTPTGASSAVGLRASVNDAGGNRYVLGSARSHTQDLVQGGLEKASTTTLDFFIGSAIGGSGAVAGDTPGDLCLQYLGALAETVIGAIR
jgi:hypothetical protein